MHWNRKLLKRWTANEMRIELMVWIIDENWWMTRMMFKWFWSRNLITTTSLRGSIASHRITGTHSISQSVSQSINHSNIPLINRHAHSHAHLMAIKQTSNELIILMVSINCCCCCYCNHYYSFFGCLYYYYYCCCCFL